MSQTTGTQSTFDKDEALYLDYLSGIGHYFQPLGLLGGLYGMPDQCQGVDVLTMQLGVLTVLSVLSVYALIQYVSSIGPV